MADFPEENLEETNAAMASALEATAAILPWLSKPKQARFPADLNQRWVIACQRLQSTWSDRHVNGEQDVRSAIFALYGLTLESADIECMRLGEALASATDCLDQGQPPPRIIAALSGCIECLNDSEGLEHPAFAERVTHFAVRLERSISAAGEIGERSSVIDRLFVAETHERLERMHDALAALPPDAYALLNETGELLQHAEHLALHGIVHAVRKLLKALQLAGKHNSLESEAIRTHILLQLAELDQLNDAVDT